MADMVAWFLLTCVLTGMDATQGTGTIRVTCVLGAPYLMMNGSSVYYGMIVDMLYEMERISAVKFQLSLVPDRRFGSQLNGTWNGMIGQIIDNKADMVAAPLVVTMLRERDIDFIMPFQSFDAMIVLNKRRPRHGPTISGLSDLANQNTLQYGLVKSGSLKNKINASTDKDIQKLMQTMAAHPAWMKLSNSDGVYAVRRNVNYAFITEGATARYIAGRLPCDLDVVPTGFARRQCAFAVRNMSPLRDVINEALTKLRESGELARIEKKWWSDECSGAERFGGAGVVVVLVALVGALLSR